MKTYAKIVDNKLEYAPRNKNGISNWIYDEKAVLAEGYLPVELQETVPDGMLVSGYEVKSNKIVYKFTKAPKPVDLTYAELRQNEYPAIEEQLDMIYWDKINGTSKWQDLITEIKNKYPKPTEEK
jgi:hypothetical protein